MNYRAGGKYIRMAWFQYRKYQEHYGQKVMSVPDFVAGFNACLELSRFIKKLPLARNYCYAYDACFGRWTAYLMLGGAEQCIGSYHFPSKEAVIEFYEENGITNSFAI